MRYVYVVGNIVNWKVYVGQSKNPIARLKGHFLNARNGIKRRFYDAIRKHGENNFQFQIIEQCEDSLINEREQFWIAHFDSFNPLRGYNATTGGNAFFHHSVETKRKIGDASRGNTYNKNRKVSEETKQKLSVALKNNPKVIAAQTGRTHSEETKHKMSLSHLGISKSSETREKMKQHALNRSLDHLKMLNKARRKRSPLNDEKVRQIKSEWKFQQPLQAGKKASICRELAKRFSVTPEAIDGIVTGKFWIDIDI